MERETFKLSKGRDSVVNVYFTSEYTMIWGVMYFDPLDRIHENTLMAVQATHGMVIVIKWKGPGRTTYKHQAFPCHLIY